MSLTSELDIQIAEAVDAKLDEKLRNIIREEISEALRTYQHPCRLTITNEQANSVAKYVHNVTRIGGTGDVEDGFDVIRSNHLWLNGLRQGGAKAAFAFFMLLMTGAAAAFLSIIWDGFKNKITH